MYQLHHEQRKADEDSRVWRLALNMNYEESLLPEAYDDMNREEQKIRSAHR